MLSEAVVRRQVGNVPTKAGVRDRVQAVLYVYESGLVTARVAAGQEHRHVRCDVSLAVHLVDYAELFEVGERVAGVHAVSAISLVAGFTRLERLDPDLCVRKCGRDRVLIFTSQHAAGMIEMQVRQNHPID